MYLIILKKYDSNYSKFKSKNCIKKRKRNKKIKKVLKIQNLVIKLRKRFKQRFSITSLKNFANNK